jgi:hypothetical protein
MDPRDEDRLDEAIARFAGLIRAIEQRQSATESRLAGLYQLTFVAFIVVVASISFLTIILSQQMPDITAALMAMNADFVQVADDMDRVERSIRRMAEDVHRLPGIIAEVDRMHTSTGFMANDVDRLSLLFAEMDGSIGTMEVGVTDMRQSFEIMQINVGRMGSDVNHMSQPMRMFNWMSPFR